MVCIICCAVAVSHIARGGRWSRSVGRRAASDGVQSDLVLRLEIHALEDVDFSSDGPVSNGVGPERWPCSALAGQRRLD